MWLPGQTAEVDNTSHVKEEYTFAPRLLDPSSTVIFSTTVYSEDAEPFLVLANPARIFFWAIDVLHTKAMPSCRPSPPRRRHPLVNPKTLIPSSAMRLGTR